MQLRLRTQELKTSDKWKEELFPKLIILDPDGFDRQNFQYSFYEEPVTKEEFIGRIMECTVISNRD